ncbi:F-box/WD repeat-containing protein 4 isoform X4 [Anarhichas minor]|uniref:F-box/WD repeat-containing protein 4 isoform X4 n=1 Tax=Anarhichas minor TaxID=65739 RepID=UPI003F739141
MLLSQLPEDVLYHILSYLGYKSLSRLSQVCKTTYHFVNRDAVWRNIAKEFLNTGITRNGTDIYPSIPLKERVTIAQNWYDGVCKKAIPLKWKAKLLPWLQLEGNVLFLSQAADIGAYHLRSDSGRLRRNPFKIYSGHKGDVCRFVLTDSHLISGGSDGRILVHSRRRDMSVELSGHNQEVNCLDSKDGLIVSGSRDRTTRIWSLTSSCPRDTIPMYDRVWSVAISPTLRSFVTGTACCENFSPLRVWDVERARSLSEHSCAVVTHNNLHILAKVKGRSVFAVWAQSFVAGPVCWTWCLSLRSSSSPAAMIPSSDCGTSDSAHGSSGLDSVYCSGTLRHVTRPSRGSNR